LPQDCQGVAGTNAVTVVDKHPNDAARYQRRDIYLDDLERAGGDDCVSVGPRARANHEHNEPERAIHE
jgi:hypothetical protein